MTKTPNIQVVTATEAKNRFGEMLKRVYQRDEHLIVERDGIPVAVLVPIQDYSVMPSVKGTTNAVADALERERRKAFAAADMREFLDRVQEGKPVYSEEEVQKDVENAIRAVRGR